MTLPFALLAGLLVAMASQELAPALPGSGDWWRVAGLAPALLLPALLAFAARGALLRQLVTGRPARVPPRALLRLSAFAVPSAVHALFAFGSYGDCIERAAWDSPLLEVVLLLAPAFLAEFTRVVPATHAQLLAEVVDDRDPRPLDPRLLPTARELRPMVRLRLGWPLLVLMPLLVFGLLSELAARSRDVQTFVLLTSPGIMVSALVFLVVSVLALPFVFRAAFGVDDRLPEPLGKRLREVAATLGFPPRGVLRLRTGNRSLNAMMVGPLPIGRFLCITDGLLGALDPEALAGVVAHEVAHARLGHVRWFLVVALVLAGPLFSPWLMREANEWSVPAQLALVLGVASIGFLVMRTLAHRFEREADAGSVRALGAGPCSQALFEARRQVGPVDERWWNRLFSMHPDEPERWQHMRRYEVEPVYRERFDRRGRSVRAGIVAAACVMAAVVAASWWRDWPIERALWRLHSGDIVGATEAAGGIEAVPPVWQRTWTRFHEDLAAARALAPTARAWPAAQQSFAVAWPRAESVLLSAGPAAARPWFALALTATNAPSDLQRALHEFCRAAAEQEPERMEQLRDLVRRLGVPASLAPVFAD